MSSLPFPPNLPSRKIIVAGLVLSAILLLGFAVLYRSLYSPSVTLSENGGGTENEIASFEITPGSSLSAVADELQQLEFIHSAFSFKLLARWRGLQGDIKTGEYLFSAGQSAADLLDKMVSGETVQYRVTLVEGWTFQQALDAIWSMENISVELEGKTAQEISQLLNLEQESPEGQLFPDTYFFTKGESDLELLLRANRRLQQVLNEAWQSRLGALPFETPYEALILASIVEKESAVNSERGHVAGVFVRRLESGMRLQSDPTVIYGMGERFQGNITRSDLREETDYNTYRISGLPPTPIALAGLDSINATLHPLDSDYLYFVSRGDGSHQFSSNLEQHNQAVREFQLQGRDDDEQTDR